MIPWSPWNWEVFLLVILALLALSLIVLGILTAYFGSGKSRIAGAALLIIGLVVAVMDIVGPKYMFHFGLGQWAAYVALGTIFYVIAAIIGVVIGLLVFLGFIMKT
ncbi:hypothetical protein [Thermoplasma acidophilum]|uniref:hypothetical protein n=1 Tax=Thermoplasma acidophilum TaxID=2303 RepID=UPI00001660FE|nr:hypothetical protein [Thermoplasma acidophilum]